MKIELDPSLHAYFEKVKLLALDVDGVMTDGSLYYSESGEEFRKFNVKDGMGLKRLQHIGIQLAIITNSQCSAVEYRAQKLGIQHCILGVEDKLKVLKTLSEKMDIPLSQIAYVGDDIIDLPVMKAVGCPLTVADAMPENQACAVYVTQLGGGQGGIREICELLILAHN